MTQNNKLILAKKLLYKSTHRGCKETDIILGNYARKYLANMSYDELKIFEQILNLPDSDIYNWYTKKTKIPTEHDSSIMQQLMKS